MQNEAGELLKRTGFTILLTSLTNSAAFLIAALVPIPALRVFSLQVSPLLQPDMYWSEVESQYAAFYQNTHTDHIYELSYK